MATETWEEIEAGWATKKAARKQMLFALVWGLLFAALVGNFAWHQAVQRTNRAAAQARWAEDLKRIGMDYAGMLGAVDANDEFAYRQQLQTIWRDQMDLSDTGMSLIGDGDNWKERSATEDRIRDCVFFDVKRFNMQQPDHLATCKALLPPNP